MTLTCGWQEIPEHLLTLRGAGASIVLVADEMIPNLVIGFDVSISIGEGLAAPIRWRGRGGMYHSLGDFRTQLSRLRSGELVEVRFSLDNGFGFVIYHHRRGVQSTLCVSGTVSSPCEYDDAWFGPSGEQEMSDQLLRYDKVAYCLRFAFKTPIVDPPYIDDFLRDLDALLSYLKES